MSHFVKWKDRKLKIQTRCTCSKFQTLYLQYVQDLPRSVDIFNSIQEQSKRF